jgi:hypothetical protein
MRRRDRDDGGYDDKDNISDDERDRRRDIVNIVVAICEYVDDEWRWGAPLPPLIGIFEFI